jgi:hypothetical protein
VLYDYAQFLQDFHVSINDNFSILAILAKFLVKMPPKLANVVQIRKKLPNF